MDKGPDNLLIQALCVCVCVCDGVGKDGGIRNFGPFDLYT